MQRAQRPGTRQRRLVGVVVVGSRQAAAEQMQRELHREVDADHALGMAVPEVGRDQRTPIGAVRRKTPIAQPLHELSLIHI